MMTQFINWIITNSTEVKTLSAENQELRLVISKLKEENRLLNEQIQGKVYDI
jgi:hypothetical protein